MWSDPKKAIHRRVPRAQLQASSWQCASCELWPAPRAAFAYHATEAQQEATEQAAVCAAEEHGAAQLAGAQDDIRRAVRATLRQDHAQNYDYRHQPHGGNRARGRQLLLKRADSGVLVFLFPDGEHRDLRAPEDNVTLPEG